MHLLQFVVSSILPLIASISGLFLKNYNQRLLARQVVINIASMVLFLVVIDVSLFFQYISWFASFFQFMFGLNGV